MKQIEIKELRTGELVKVDHDWYVYGEAEISGEVDEESGETEQIYCHALYTINEWLGECESELTIKDCDEINEYVSRAFEHYVTPDQITRTGKFMKGWKP